MGQTQQAVAEAAAGVFGGYQRGTGAGQDDRALWKKLAQAGLLGLAVPGWLGGEGLGVADTAVLLTEAGRAAAPVPALATLAMGVPPVTRWGSRDQQQALLAGVPAGDALLTAAVREPSEPMPTGPATTVTPDDGTVSGVWLACRTDPDAPRHKGISILIVDTTDPGYSWTPIITLDGAHHTNATYYSDVRVPVTRRVGAENAGWRLVTTQLNHERVMLGPAGRLAALHDRVRDWAAARTGPDGRPLLDQPDVRRALGRTFASLRVNELLNWQVAAADTVDVADASVTKVYSSVRLQQLGQLLEEVVARHGDPAEEETAQLRHWLDIQAKRNVVLTFGGGVNEIQRELIATAGLGLPRVPRGT